MFNQPLQIILCASNTGLTAGTWRGKQLQNVQHFKKDEQGLAAFNIYLEIHARVNIYLIANALEEDYSLEILPHTSGKMRADLLERKLNQWSRNAVYKAAHFIGRVTDQRKNDRFLFAAINNTSFIQSWIDVINALGASLVGIYMLPMISEVIGQIITRQQKFVTSHILLCEPINAGFRQSYLHNGLLQMSRMLPIKDISPNKLSAFYATETEKMRLYLQSQRCITAETTLNLVLLATENYQEIAQLPDLLIDQLAGQVAGPSRNTNYIFFDTYRFAKTLMVNPELIKLNPELLHMQLLANGSFPSNLAPLALTNTYRLNKFRHIMMLGSGLIAGFGLLIASFCWYHTLGLNAQIKIALAQTAQQQYLHQKISQTFPTTSLATTELKSSVDLANTLLKQTKTPERLMQVISEALDQQPQIALIRLRWVLSNDSNLKDEADSSVQETAVVRPIEKTLTTPNQPVTDPFTLLEIGFVNAKINDFIGDYHAANISVAHLLARLKTNPEVAQVVLLQAPINESSLANLQGNTSEKGSVEQVSALFKIKLVLKPLVFATQ